MINLFGAVALLLFGLAQVKDECFRAFGARLRSGLATGTRSGLRSFVSGFVATSGAAELDCDGIDGRLLRRARAGESPRMAQIVLLGANVGTAVTAWIVATGIEWLSPLVILVGTVLHRSGSTTPARAAGTALIGIGLMLLSLHLLSRATEPMRQIAGAGRLHRPARQRLAGGPCLLRRHRLHLVVEPCCGRC